MKRSIDLDDDLATEVERTASLVHEKPATVIRLAIRAGLPVVGSRFQAPRPEGYFADCYKGPEAEERGQFEEAMQKATKQKPER